MRRFAVALCLLAPVLAPRPSEACGASPSCPGWQATTNLQVPANFQAMPFASPVLEDVLDAGVELRRKDGGVMAIDLARDDGGFGLIRPKAPLEPDERYEVFANTWCGQDGSRKSERLSEFSTGAARPMPKELGVVTVGSRSVELSPEGRSPCGDVLPKVREVRSLYLKPSPELVFWNQFMRVDVEVGGVVRQRLEYGYGPAGIVTGTPVVLTRNCDDGAERFADGTYPVVLVASLADGPVLRIAPVEVEFACPVEEAPGCSATAAGPASLVPLLALAAARARRRIR